MRSPAHRAPAADPTVYPVDESMGEGLLQRRIIELLRPLLERWLAFRKQTALVGADQFIYWKQHNPHVRVSPDIYVLPGFPADTDVTSWKTWETGVVPSFALEVVSRDWAKDYTAAPPNYDALGVSELVIFDPKWRSRSGRRFQVYRRLRGRRFAQVEVTNEDRVHSKVLGCWLLAVGIGRSTRLRVSVGTGDDDLFPTAEEAERAAKEDALAAREVERAAKEVERAAKEDALAAKEVERAAKEDALAAREVERTAKEAAMAKVAELETRLAFVTPRKGSRRRR